MQKKIITKSAEETQKLGKKIAGEMKSRKTAVVLGLQGDLGSGKTTFLQGFARGLNIKEKILSPTFVIMKKFQAPTQNFKYLYHLDCYRIN
jgi:tRNA threonylcarbamoyladenosine biosynthesis protein TsaE